MIRLKKLSIINGRVFKKLEVPLAKQGCVSILGDNGAGKTTMWALLEAIVYGATPLGHRRNELVKNKKDASFVLEYDRDQDGYIIEYSRNKTKWSHSITKNGVDITPHSSVDAAKFVKEEMLGLTQAEFRGSVHLSQNTQHVLIQGKPSERKSYISSFFGLDERYDIILERAKQELASTRTELSALNNLDHTRQVLQDELNGLTFIPLEPLQEEINGATEIINNVAIEIADTERLINQCARYYELVDKANKYTDLDILITGNDADIADVAGKINSIDGLIRKNQEIEANNAVVVAANTELGQYRTKYGNINNLIKNEDKLTAQYYEMSGRKANYNKNRPFLDEYRLYNDVEYKDVSAQQEKLTEYKGELTSLTKFDKACGDSGICPTCGTKVSKAKLTKVGDRITELEGAIAALQHEINDATAQNQRYNRKQQLEQLVNSVEVYDAASEDEVLHSLEQEMNDIKELKKCVTVVATMEYQEAYPVPDKTQLLNELASLRILQSEYAAARLAQQQLPDRPELTAEEYTSKLAELNQRKTLLEADLDHRKVEYGRINQENSQYTKTERMVEELDLKLGNREPLKRKEYLFEKLVEAYGNKGLRVMQLQKIMDMVIGYLPHYTKFLFKETDLSFKYVCDSGNIEIMAVRREKDGNKMVEFEHDISSFSGGEQRKLSVAFILTLAKCIPSHKKTNVLILDEVDTNLDQAGQYLFVSELLPVLREEYESVFVISHNEDVQQAAVFDRTWKLNKRNHWTDLIEIVH